MQENWQQIISRFDSNEDFVLATIVATRGSTYRKTGTMMLIDQQGACTGLLSGGCLEADISCHAQEVLHQTHNKLLTYDLKADAELLWGLGLGCEGAIDILLQPLNANNQHLEFVHLIQAIEQGQSGIYCQQVSEQTVAQACFIRAPLDDKALLQQQVTNAISGKNNDAKRWLVTPVTPVWSILLCGAGPDAAPVVTMAKQLGWKVTLQDHRENNLAQSEFSLCDAKRKLRAEHLTTDDLAGFDAVIIMTHNLTNDGLLLKNALAADIDYIGLLGPAGRRDKLLAELSLTASDVEQQVFGPIGLDIGGRSPQAIALSICAEIQQFISRQTQQKNLKSWSLKCH
ncbi:xanthine and CO dehydrogenase family maturation factor XdhC/CoxF family protein [Thalassotalea insulae]|uniref:Xanthine and CO dehydrogenase family maturation factor XdhC/CoxF family protein n=1 Tax=Thalassotalea insulae TaxID=2056778 RepID=A0ABQ6GVC7_9GAMM|nr:XdhC family protein [Thalassotalea insulae]GLX79312.1 xanthine and CO dehydrogenase family maturation factor XdhC/CoxF family protein [Thalassotalea insulae]